jgi:hypothetical protein
MKRQQIKHKTTFEERLAEEARRFKEAAEEQPLGSTARELLLRRARQAETASNINNWLASPGLTIAGWLSKSGIPESARTATLKCSLWASCPLSGVNP